MCVLVCVRECLVSWVFVYVSVCGIVMYADLLLLWLLLLTLVSCAHYRYKPHSRWKCVAISAIIVYISILIATYV